MPVTYNKLRKLLRDNGVTSYRIRKDKIVGQAVWTRIQNDGEINTKTIATFCKLLNCQPGDILEYIPDGDFAECAAHGPKVRG